MTIPQGYATARQHPLRTAGFAVFAIMLALTAVFISRQDTGAVPGPTTFELDGNTHSPGAVEDWVDVFNDVDTADRSRFTRDFNFPAGTQPNGDDQPATGATKDPNDMDQWDCKAAGLSPPKNDIANAFVASYTVGGQQLIYFGLDRINSDNGTANVGFWFTKDNHSCNLATGLWNDQKHSEGDTLVVSEFTAGGRVSTINVFRWCSDPAAPDLRCGNSTLPIQIPAPGSGDGPLQLIFSGADCLDDNGVPISNPDANRACATVNRGINNDGPEWPYKGAAQGGRGKPCAAADLVVPGNNNSGCKTYERGAFFEGGINATALGLDLVCLGTFIADTRSAASTEAQLHDFTVSQVDLCDSSVSTQSSTNSLTVLPGTAVSDTATVAQTPASAPVPTGSVTFFLCGPGLATAASATTGCPTGGTQIGGAINLVGGVATSANTTPAQTQGIGLYCWRAEYSGDDNYPSPDADHIHTNNTTECFRTFNPSTLISFSDQIVGLPSDATGTVNYEVYNTEADCNNEASRVADITPVDNAIALADNGVAPQSLSYTPASPGGSFYLRAVFTGNGTYTDVNFESCIEHVDVFDVAPTPTP